MEQRDGFCTVHRSIPCRIWEIVARPNGVKREIG
jgi:hypothetical protein